METERLFYKNQYLIEFTANIIESKKACDKFNLILDKTAFFPGGGGQNCDTGFIGLSEVIEVKEVNGEIVHILDKMPEKSKDILCKINWERRKDGMYKHLGQHVLSGSFFTLFNKNTAGIHLGHDLSYVDIVGDVSQQEIAEAEIKANSIIDQDKKVEFIITERENIQKYKLRRVLQTEDKTIRIVKIQDLDINACCGVHPSTTKELDFIKITGFEKHKNNTRIFFRVGLNAVINTLNRDIILTKVCNTLNSGEDDALNTLLNIIKSEKELKEENKKIKVSLIKYQLDDLFNNALIVNNIKLIQKDYDNEDKNYLNSIIKKIVEKENTVALITNKSQQKANIIFSCSKNLEFLKLNEILKESLKFINGKGGGNSTLSQGSGDNDNKLKEAVNYAVEKIKEKTNESNSI